MKAKPKQERKVRDLLNKHYAYLENKGASLADEVVDESMLAMMGDKDYSPVVLFAINTVV